jgi:hypothetical protein
MLSVLQNTGQFPATASVRLYIQGWSRYLHPSTSLYPNLLSRKARKPPRKNLQFSLDAFQV